MSMFKYTQKLKLFHCFVVAATQPSTVSVTPSETNNSIAPITASPATPLTSSSIVNNDNGLRRTPIENWAINFNILFEMFPRTFHKACADKIRATKTDVLEVARRLGDETSKVSNRPGSANLAIIASALVAKFPLSLADYANSQLIGDGSKSLHRRLTKHFENRPHVGNSPKKRLVLEEVVENESKQVTKTEVEPAAKKSQAKSKKDSYGSCNWQPVDLPYGLMVKPGNHKRKSMSGCAENSRRPRRQSFV
jgi:hypothetical protein